MSNAFVVAMGIGTVFVGLISIIILCKIIGAICSIGVEKSANTSTETPISEVSNAPVKIENRQEIIAAVSAAVAEELGTDISAIRILSFKRI